MSGREIPINFRKNEQGEIPISSRNKMRNKVNLPINWKYGIAFCHRKEHTPLNELYPFLEGINIKWLYVDYSINKDEEEEDSIHGDIHDYELYMKLRKKRRVGYDYIVFQGCPCVEIGSYLNPLINAVGLLNDSGKIISSNFHYFYGGYIDHELRDAYKKYIDYETRIQKENEILLSDEFEENFYEHMMCLLKLINFSSYELINNDQEIYVRRIIVFNK